jgi:inner membrane protein
VPLEFWKRKMIWRGDVVGGSGEYDLLKGLNGVTLDREIVPLNLNDPRLAAAAKRDAHVRAFLFWSRMPVVIEDGGRAYLTDQRFLDSGTGSRGRGNFTVPLDKPAGASS